MLPPHPKVPSLHRRCEVAVRMLALTYLSVATLRTSGIGWLSRIPRMFPMVSLSYFQLKISFSAGAVCFLFCRTYLNWMPGLYWQSLNFITCSLCMAWSGQVVVACPAHTYLFDPIVGTCLWDQWEPVGSMWNWNPPFDPWFRVVFSTCKRPHGYVPKRTTCFFWVFQPSIL